MGWEKLLNELEKHADTGIVAKAREFALFAEDHGLSIHPGRDLTKWAEIVIKGGGVCPCVPGREHCPCQFVDEDIEELGRCRCGLFCHEAYADDYAALRAETKAGKRCSRKRKGSSSARS